MPNRPNGASAAVLPSSATDYYVEWLRRQRGGHRLVAMTEFIRQHPFMLGRQVGIVVAMYYRWIMRTARTDDESAFGDFISERYDRWRAARRDAVRRALRCS